MAEDDVTTTKSKAANKIADLNRPMSKGLALLPSRVNEGPLTTNAARKRLGRFPQFGAPLPPPGSGHALVSQMGFTRARTG